MTDGALLINKPRGMTSHDVVNKVRRLYGTKKVGHTGTLDPMATGVLVVLVGRAAKAAEYLTEHDKCYKAGLRLGIKTDSGDVTGNTINTCDTIPSESDFMAMLDRFRGKIMQVPPMYSALKVNGQKLCDLARKGITVERTAREIEIFSLEAEKISDREYSLNVHCSKGTYIRTLCEDIGEALSCFGTMSSLERTASGIFKLDSCHTLEELEAMELSERESLLIPTEELFYELPAVTLPDFFYKLATSGNEIYQKKIGTSFKDGEYISLYGKDGFFAIGKVTEFDDGSAIKPVKQFKID